MHPLYPAISFRTEFKQIRNILHNLSGLHDFKYFLAVYSQYPRSLCSSEVVFVHRKIKDKSNNIEKKTASPQLRRQGHALPR